MARTDDEEEIDADADEMEVSSDSEDSEMVRAKDDEGAVEVVSACAGFVDLVVRNLCFLMSARLKCVREGGGGVNRMKEKELKKKEI